MRRRTRAHCRRTLSGAGTFVNDNIKPVPTSLFTGKQQMMAISFSSASTTGKQPNLEKGGIRGVHKAGKTGSLGQGVR